MLHKNSKYIANYTQYTLTALRRYCMNLMNEIQQITHNTHWNWPLVLISLPFHKDNHSYHQKWNRLSDVVPVSWILMLMPTTDKHHMHIFSNYTNILFLSSQLGYFLSHRGSRWVECAGYQLQVFPGVIQYANSFNSNSRFCLYFSSTRICLLQRLFSIQRIVCQAYKGKQTNQTQCRYVDSAGYQLQYLMTRHIYLFL